MKRLFYIYLLFTGLLNAEQIALQCGMGSRTLSVYQMLSLDKVRLMGTPTYDQRNPLIKYVLIDKDKNLIEIGGFADWKDDLKLRTNDNTYDWGPFYTKGLSFSAISYESEFLKFDKTTTPVYKWTYSINRETLRIKETTTHKSHNTYNGWLIAEEKILSECNIISLELLKENKEKIIKRKIERNEKYKI